MASKKPKKKVISLVEIGREFPTADEFPAFVEEWEAIHGRAAALSQTSFIEAQLERAIGLNLYPHDVDHYAAIFHGAGAPLASFSSRIMVAAALRILNPAQRKACDQMRRVRNLFAHSIRGLDFDTPAVAAECMKLDPQNVAPPNGVFQSEKNDARERFRVTGMLISLHLMRYMQTAVELRRAAGTWNDVGSDTLDEKASAS